MNIQAFVNDGRRKTCQAFGQKSRRQHIQVARDDQIGVDQNLLVLGRAVGSAKHAPDPIKISPVLGLTEFNIAPFRNRPVQAPIHEAVDFISTLFKGANPFANGGVR